MSLGGWNNQNMPAVPKVAIVAPPTLHVLADGSILDINQVHIQARIISMGTLHHAFTATGAIALAAAARIPNTVVNTTIL